MTTESKGISVMSGVIVRFLPGFLQKNKEVKNGIEVKDHHILGKEHKAKPAQC